MCVSSAIALFNQCTASCFSESMRFVLSTVNFKPCGEGSIQIDSWIQEKAWPIAYVPKNTNAENMNSQVSCLVG